MIRGPDSPISSGPPLLIVGASARAAAFSALRAGFAPVCLDQFADADLQAAAPVERVGKSTADFVKHAARHPGVPVLYTGGLENHPGVLEQLAAGNPLWGLEAAPVRNVRDPQQLSEALASARMPHLEVAGSDAPPAADGEWLLKPQASAGGRGITPWTDKARHSPVLKEPHYFQRWVEGRAFSGVFIAYEGVGDVRFVGLTEQLIGEAAFHAQEFTWCGNIGPVTLSVEVESTVRRIANFLKWKFSLRGLFGIDFVVTPEGTVGVTEVNPRYPASTEILEFATGVSLLRDHCSCFCDNLKLPAVEWQPAPGTILGKSVIYSPSRVTVRFQLDFDADGFRSWPRYADVPPAGTKVARGEPVLTLFSKGASVATCREELCSNADAMLSRA